jgi:uncharacterized protein YjbI with pentapeptide repeats
MWMGATVIGTDLGGAIMSDARLGDALFVECSFRGADLSCVNLGTRGTAIGAKFVRCDLRESVWARRELDGVSFVDCHVHGLRGAPNVQGLMIERLDLSPCADGSAIATAEDIARVALQPFWA